MTFYSVICDGRTRYIIQDVCGEVVKFGILLLDLNIQSFNISTIVIFSAATITLVNKSYKFI